MSETQEIVEVKEENNITDNNKKSKSARDEVTEENCRFEEGQLINLVRIRFPGHNKSYPFLIGKRKLIYGQKVVAMSDRGMAVGYTNSFSYQLPFKKDMLPIKYISKVANEEDIEKEKEIYKKQKDAENLCQSLIEKHNLAMNLTHVEFTGFGKKVVFYFVAPARVDFRGLVKDLVSELKLRIELRQISVRDRAASMGALGPCGRELCCSSFLSKYGNVSIKMAKNQNLTLNYSKLNGVCGQLKCCLQYEDDVYSAKRKKLPEEGKFIKTQNGELGRVNRVHILSEQFDLLTNRGHIKRYVSEMFDKEVSRDEAKFPNRFDNISDETATVVGLSDYESKKTRQFEKDIEKINRRANKFAHETFNEVTGQELEYVEPEIVEEVDPKNAFKAFHAKTNLQAKEISPVNEPLTEEKTEEENKPKRNNKRPNNRNRNRNRNRNNKNRKNNNNNNKDSNKKSE